MEWLIYNERSELMKISKRTVLKCCIYSMVLLGFTACSRKKQETLENKPSLEDKQINEEPEDIQDKETEEEKAEANAKAEDNEDTEVKEDQKEVDTSNDADKKYVAETSDDTKEEVLDMDFTVPFGYDYKFAQNPMGEVVSIEYPSTTTGSNRKANVILPPNYTEEKEYPIMFMVHGVGGDHNDYLGDNSRYIIWNLINEGKAKEMIVVYPNARAREDDSKDPKDIFSLAHYQAFDRFLEDLTKDLLPYMKEHYSVAEGRENTAIAGFSMGGRVALHIGFTLPDQFGYIGAFCPAFGILEYTNYGVYEEGLFTEDSFVLPEEYQSMVMIVKGQTDTIVKEEPSRYHQVLENNGQDHLYYELPWGHEYRVWAEGYYNFARRIFK